MRWQEKVHIGTSGYAYPGWVGPFYPDGTRRQGMLAYYSHCFGAVELNFTYYGIPGPESLARMVRETDPSFRFFVKAYRGITHEGEANRHRGAFLRCLDPVREAGRLGGVLLQFPQSFHNTRDHRQYLRSLVTSLDGLTIIVEVRHDCWLEQGFFEFLRSRRVSFCCVDEPRIEGLLPPMAVATSSLGYLRLHSRHPGRWYSGDDRYDYDFSREDLLEWIPKLRKLAGMTTSVYVFFNNCHGAQAARNALHLQRLLDRERHSAPGPSQGRLFS